MPLLCRCRDAGLCARQAPADLTEADAQLGGRFHFGLCSRFSRERSRLLADGARSPGTRLRPLAAGHYRIFFLSPRRQVEIRVGSVRKMGRTTKKQ